jgi:GntR family transcriptional repressor for pyruvate dehydrogenase complex
MTAPQQVAAAIKQEILEGGLCPGDKLPSEEELAGLFGVSRPTARAGLQALCASHVLVVQRGRGGGYRVSDFSLTNLGAHVGDFISLSLVVDQLTPEQFLEVRYAHEVLCAEAAAERRTNSDLDALDAISDAIAGSALSSRDAFELDLTFHRALADASHNPLIVGFEGAMIAGLHRLLDDGDSVDPTDSLGNVGEIIHAVRDRDPNLAGHAMRCHLEHSVTHYRRSGVTATPVKVDERRDGVPTVPETMA